MTAGTPRRSLLQRTAVGKQPGKDIMHDVHALLIVVQEEAGQPEHGPVMLLEQPFDLSFPVCHTLYIHTQVDLLNPFPQLF